MKEQFKTNILSLLRLL